MLWLMNDENTTHTADRVASTVIWGDLETRNFLKLPKMFAYLGHYDGRVGREIQPRHLLLVIALASRKFRTEPIIASWTGIALGLGVRPDTVRRWAYELRNLGLLEISATTGPRGGDGPNSFDIEPFVQLLEAADEKWRRWRESGGSE